jgi:hypothetical protein
LWGFVVVTVVVLLLMTLLLLVVFWLFALLLFVDLVNGVGVGDGCCCLLLFIVVVFRGSLWVVVVVVDGVSFLFVDHRPEYRILSLVHHLSRVSLGRVLQQLSQECGERLRRRGTLARRLPPVLGHRVPGDHSSVGGVQT